MIWVISLDLLRDLIHKVVLGGVVRQLVTYCPDDTLDSLIESLYERVTIDFTVHLGALALVKHLCNVGVVFDKVLCWLAIVQENQHVGHALLQLVGRVVMRVLSL